MTKAKRKQKPIGSVWRIEGPKAEKRESRGPEGGEIEVCGSEFGPHTPPYKRGA